MERIVVTVQPEDGGLLGRGLVLDGPVWLAVWHGFGLWGTSNEL